MFVNQLQDSLLFVHFPLQTENLLKFGRSLSDQLTPWSNICQIFYSTTTTVSNED